MFTFFCFWDTVAQPNALDPDDWPVQMLEREIEPFYKTHGKQERDFRRNTNSEEQKTRCSKRHVDWEHTAFAAARRDAAICGGGSAALWARWLQDAAILAARRIDAPFPSSQPKRANQGRFHSLFLQWFILNHLFYSLFWF